MVDQGVLFPEDLKLATGAVFDPTKRYRYLLWRRWAEGAPLLWIMLNPSTADEFQLDPTLRRCIDYTQRWGFPGMEIANVYGYRSTAPKVLWTVPDPVGPDNLQQIAAAVGRAGMVIAGWGRHAKEKDWQAVWEICGAAEKPPYALSVTKANAPGHPLYLPKTSRPFIWVPGDDQQETTR